MARVTGVSPVAVRPVASNRFRAGLAETVSPVRQAGLCVLDVAGVSFSEAVRRVRRDAMAAYEHAYVDPAGVQDLIAAAVRDRGPAFDVDCFVDDRRDEARYQPYERPDAQEIRAALPESTFRWAAASDTPSARLSVQVDDVPGAVRLTVAADTHHLSPADAEALLRAVETVAVDAALAGTRQLRPV